MWGHRGYSPWVQSWRGMTPRWLTVAAWPSQASTASHGLTQDPPAPRMGSQASSFSPPDPPLVQLLQEAVDWCMRRLLQVLGFDLKWQKFEHYGPLFIGVSALSWRGFDRDAVLIPQSDSFTHWLGLTRRARNPGVVRVWNELPRGCWPRVNDVKPGRLPWADRWPNRPAWWKPLGLYVGRAWRRETKLVWADEGSFGPWPYFRVKTFLIFQTIFQFTNYFEFNSNLNFEWFLLAK
jgi:hypothetical protein